MLRGKHALERAGQLLKKLSTSQKSGAAKRSPMALPEDDAALLISFLERLGWTFERVARSPQENLCAWLTHSTGRDATNEELAAIWQEYEAYAHGLKIPDQHCLGIARYLLSNPLNRAMSCHWVDNTRSPHFTYALQLQFDAQILYEQLEDLDSRFGFELVPPPRTSLDLHTGPDHVLFPPAGMSDLVLGSPLMQSGEDKNYRQFSTQRNDLDNWLKECCGSVLQTARNRLELPRSWELAELNECDWPSSPVTSSAVIQDWIESRLSRFCELRDAPNMQDTCLQTGQRDLRNARRALSMLKITFPAEFTRDPVSIGEAEERLEQLIQMLGSLTGDEVPPEHPESPDHDEEQYTEPLWKGFLCFVFGDCDDKTLATRLAEYQVSVHPEDALQKSKKKIRLRRDSLIDTSIYGEEKLMAKKEEWNRKKMKKM